MIYLLRHGQTEFNTQGRYQGRLDSPLTDLGRRQAQACGRLLAGHVAKASIWTSPLPRAEATARLMAQILPDAEVRLDQRLREVSFGAWEGLTRAEIVAGWPDIRKRYPRHQWKLHAPQGEGIAAVLARLREVLRDAMAQPAEIILISHGVAGRLMRGLHADLSLSEALALEAPQDVIYRLHRSGLIEALPRVSC
jgi:probable phosphoglycerate mutase